MELKVPVLVVDPKIKCPECDALISGKELKDNLLIRFWDWGHGFDVTISTSCKKCKTQVDYIFRLDDTLIIDKIK